MAKAYIAIDLKSFYASVECVERGLDPLRARLVVADQSRTDKTICLAVSPALKAFGISGRARLYEVVRRVNEINRQRKPNTQKLDYIVATPRMAYYMRYSARIYDIYLRFIAPDDIFAYSIDEVFIDATSYLKLYKMSAKELAQKIIQTVLNETGITATAGIGTNMYLAKVAMDIVAKHAEPDKNGVRIAELDEKKYRRTLWSHQPLTDFWRVGRGYAKQLEKANLHTMGDIALCSERNEDFLYKLFGINAELLVDHAWGYEPCEIQDVKQYRPRSNSFSSGQVLKEPYDFKKARTVVTEMAEEIALSLLQKQLTANQVTLTIGYDKSSLDRYNGETKQDFYGRSVPKPAHGSFNLSQPSASTSQITRAALSIFDQCVNPELSIRKITIDVNHVMPEEQANHTSRQLDLFTDHEKEIEQLAKEHQINQAILALKRRYGKNAILKGVNFDDGATGRERNAQIGGHKG